METKIKMLTLIATGKSSVDDATPLYLWGYGNSKYEIEAQMSKSFTESEVLNTSYEDALEKFEMMVNTVNFAAELSATNGI